MDTHGAPTGDPEGELRGSPYAQFQNDELILRDELAIDRTLLANERTLLAYLRSAIGLLIAGVTIMHFGQEGWFWGVGVGCLPCGVVAGVIGIIRFRSMDRSISQLRVRPEARAGQAGDAARPGAGRGDAGGATGNRC
ncbi:MAG TPA: DUF202 domain-containing protein [Planctomycetota bacterium]|nr:DUF202 domain-containing protein [Planctomycetota bacterium]